jgi:hypothetical protein
MFGVVCVLACLVSAGWGGFLAAVGSCQADSCRLLYEGDAARVLRIVGLPDLVLPATKGAPQVHVVRGLRSAIAYSGMLGDVPVRFVTAGKASRVAFVSCNRGVKDRDFDMYEELARTERDLTVHLGDQVYVDSLWKHVKGNETFTQLLKAIRGVYRRSWEPIVGALLSSSNVMIPDDHEVINNLDARARRSPATDLFVRAARQAFYEYQYALHADCPSFDPVKCPIYRVQSLAPQLSLLLVDTRFERAFVATDDSLLGERQRQFLERVPVQSNDTLIVATSVPLMLINPFLCWVAEKADGEYYPLAASRPVFANDVRLLLDLAATKAKKSYLVAGDVHHYSMSHITGSNASIVQVVTSGMTRGSTAGRAPHSAVLFWATSLFPPSLGPYSTSAPREVFLGKNFVMLERGAEGEMTIEPHFEAPLEGIPGLTQDLIANVKLSHYVALLAGLLSLLVLLFLRRRKQRRESVELDVTEILPGRLFLSSAGPVANHFPLVRRRFGITAVLSITQRELPLLEGVAEHLQLRVADNRDADLFRLWHESAFEFIARHKCVLVHCEAGRSRSAATVMAFLLHSGAVRSVREAYEFVKKLRTLASPNVGFMRDVARLSDSKESRDFVVRYWIELCNLTALLSPESPEDLELGWRCLERSDFHSAQASLYVIQEKRMK